MAYFRLSFLLAALAAVAVQAAAPLAEVPNLAALLERQAQPAPGTPQFDCHSNCGGAISGGRVAGHCNNSTWVEAYEACLECALEFNIWRIYQNGVTTAAASCSLTPTPSPSGSASSTGGAPSTTARPSTTGAPPTTTPGPRPNATGPGPSTTPPPVTAGAPSHAIGQLLSVGTVLAMVLAFVGAL